MNSSYFVLILSVLVAAVSQVLLKMSAKKDYQVLWKEYINIQVIGGYGLLVLSTILTIVALKGIEYKNVPVIEALGYVVIMVLSRFFFKEKITKKKVIGNLLIILGIVVFYV